MLLIPKNEKKNEKNLVLILLNKLINVDVFIVCVCVCVCIFFKDMKGPKIFSTSFLALGPKVF